MTLREELNYLLHEKAGEISMCWSDVDKAGTFDSSKAISIVEEALTAIEKLIEERENELYLKWMKNMFKQDYIPRQEAYEKAKLAMWNYEGETSSILVKEDFYIHLRKAFGIQEPQDSKQRECDNKPDGNQAVSVTPPSICHKPALPDVRMELKAVFARGYIKGWTNDQYIDAILDIFKEKL